MPARWQDIAQELTAGLRAGDPPVGAKLPSEQALCLRFGASRITLRHALAELAQRGLVRRRRGSGTWVLAAEARDRFVHDGSSVEEVLRFTADLTFTLLAWDSAPADAATAAEFGLPVGTEMATLRGLRRAPEGLPVALSVHHLPQALAAAVAPRAPFTGSLATRVAASVGESIEAIRQSLEAVALPPAEAAMLLAPAGGPALLTRRAYVGRAGNVMQTSQSLFPAGRYVHTASLRRAGTTPFEETR